MNDWTDIKLCAFHLDGGWLTRSFVVIPQISQLSVIVCNHAVEAPWDSTSPNGALRALEFLSWFLFGIANFHC